MKNFTQSEKMKAEYCCQVVRINKLEPIEGSDFLAKTIVAGNTIVVGKNDFKEGDYALYAKNETVLNKDFLSVNNLFELGECEKNSNAEEVKRLIDEKKTDEAKKITGFFNKHGRVRALKLRGVFSMGFLFGIESLAKWKPEVRYEDLSQYMVNEEMGIGENFDTVCGEEFIKVYIPYVPPKPQPTGNRNERKRERKKKRFERIADSDWRFHYDTLKANDNIWMIDPDDKVCISIKFHGSSFISGNIKIKYPAKLSLKEKVCNYAAQKVLDLYEWLKKKTVPTWYEDYGNVYSSRGVIKNKYINENVGQGYYASDIWTDINNIISPYIEEGMTVYGEICGYVTNGEKMIQKGYDYGCTMGKNYLMPYRITTVEEDGCIREWNISDVLEWTKNLVKEHPELEESIKPINILYHGTLKDLYPEIDVSSHWHEDILEAMKNDTEHFGMEKREPLCNNNVPREGIVIRVDDKPSLRAMKLKTNAFFEREKKAIDKGEVDMEMMDTYQN